jgi:hypothetical protein
MPGGGNCWKKIVTKQRRGTYDSVGTAASTVTGSTLSVGSNTPHCIKVS